MRYKIMMGVLPGYGHENKELTPETALRMGRDTINERMPDEFKSTCTVSLAAAVYAKDCPKGGELGISFSGEVNGRDEVEQLIDAVKVMMADLGQNTVTIEWEDNGRLLASTYISKGGKNVSHNAAYDGIERFSIKIPADEIEFMELGEELQDKMVEVSKEQYEPRYMISGILTVGIDANGGRYYEYSGTQNPDYGQVNSDIYRSSTLALAKQVRGTLEETKEENVSILVEFNEEQVMVGPLEKGKYLERELVFDKFEKPKKPQMSCNVIKTTIDNKENPKELEEHGRMVEPDPAQPELTHIHYIEREGAIRCGEKADDGFDR